MFYCLTSIWSIVAVVAADRVAGRQCDGLAVVSGEVALHLGDRELRSTIVAAMTVSADCIVTVIGILTVLIYPRLLSQKVGPMRAARWEWQSWWYGRYCTPSASRCSPVGPSAIHCRFSAKSGTPHEAHCGMRCRRGFRVPTLKRYSEKPGAGVLGLVANLVSVV